MRQCAVKVFTVVLWLGIAQSVYCQPPGWSSPVLIDSTQSMWASFMAVGPERQIAYVQYGRVYVSEDNGRSFELRYTFGSPTWAPPQFGPKGLAFDQNSTIWISWVWDVCADWQCEFLYPGSLFVSRSSDGGRTFDHVLKYGKGWLTSANVAYPSLIAVDRDNDVHFIRDSLWFDESGDYSKLIHVRLPDGDWTRAVETPLPLFPDSLSPGSHFNFHVPPDGKPILVTTTTRRTGPFKTYQIYSKQGQDGTFGAWIFLDALPYPLFSGICRIIQTRPDELYLTACMVEYVPLVRYYYIALRSADQGATFGSPLPISADAFLVSLADSTGLQGAGWAPWRGQSSYVRMPDLFSPIVDSASFGGARIEDFQLDGSGGKYLIFSVPALSYFIGRDITLGVLDGPTREIAARPAIDVFPNPFNSSATIRFALPERSHITVTVFNTLGQQVATLVEGEQEAGFHEAVFNASGLASGVYLYRLTAGSYVETRKLVLVR